MQVVVHPTDISRNTVSQVNAAAPTYQVSKVLSDLAAYLAGLSAGRCQVSAYLRPQRGLTSIQRALKKPRCLHLGRDKMRMNNVQA